MSRDDSFLKEVRRTARIFWLSAAAGFVLAAIALLIQGLA